MRFVSLPPPGGRPMSRFNPLKVMVYSVQSHGLFRSKSWFIPFKVMVYSGLPSGRNRRLDGSSSQALLS